MCLFLCQYHTVLITSAISKSLKKKDYFYFLAVVYLRCCTRVIFHYGEQGLLFTVVCGLLIVMASVVAEHRL